MQSPATKMNGVKQDTKSNTENNDHQKPASRLTSSRTFPVNLNHRQRSEAARPTNQTTARNGATEERQPWPKRLFVDTSDLEQSSSTEKVNGTHDANNNSDHKTKESHGKSHRYSKSRDHRLPRAVNQIASAGGARNLLPTRSFHRNGQGHSHSHSHGHGLSSGGEKSRDHTNNNSREGVSASTIDFGLLKPSHHESGRSSRFGSRSSSAHRNGGSRSASLMAREEESELNRKLSLSSSRGRDIRTMEDVSQLKGEREKGEELLRSKLASIGTLATDITRRLDYTYYNLLERISTLHSTIHTFQELVDSSTTLHESFLRDNTNLERDVRKQLADFSNFEPQRNRIEELEKRMKAGRSKMEDLGGRLEVVRKEIEGWEAREGEWQARVSRRIRVLAGFMGSVVVVLIAAYVFKIWNDGSLALSSSSSPSSSSMQNLHSRIEILSQQSKNADDDNAVTDHEHRTQSTDDDVDVNMEPFLKSRLITKPSTAPNTEDAVDDASETGPSIDDMHAFQSDEPGNFDPLRLFDEL